MNRTLRMLTLGVLSVATLTLSASAAVFQEIARFDVAGSADVAGPSYIGNNPSAVAWNGRQLFIAGFNSSGATANTAIVEVTNGASTGVNTATLSSAFGSLATPNLRGYSGLDLGRSVSEGLDRLAAAYDDGAADPNGVQLFAADTTALVWAKNARGGSGVAFDPGFSSVDSGVAWTTFGSGRRALQNTATGADIYTTANGMIINAGTGTFWRDIDFDPVTGDFYGRRSDGLIKGPRTGGNAITGASTLIAPVGSADGVAGHNLAFLSDTVAGDLVIYNDRPSTASQSFATAIKVVTSAGVSEPSSFVWLTAAPADGAGYYDFDFDPLSQTLALADFSNRTVHIFSVVPEPASAALAAALAVAVLARRRG